MLGIARPFDGGPVRAALGQLTKLNFLALRPPPAAAGADAPAAALFSHTFYQAQTGGKKKPAHRVR